MRLLLSLSAAVVIAGLTFAACNSSETKGNRASGNAVSNGSSTTTTTAQAPSSGHIAPSDGVRRVTTIELRDELNNGSAVVFDVRPASAYQQAHIKGSINIPLDEVEKRLKEFPRDKTIVTYCS